MEFDELSNLIFDELCPKLENNDGLSIFARERAKFEGWLKVELCESLFKHFEDVAPEKNRIDISFDSWGIELKTVNTNYRYNNVEKKTRPITKNVQGVIDDIEKLKSMTYSNRAVLFVVFPVTNNKSEWQEHLQKISTILKRIKFREFKFKNEIPGVVYFGTI